MRKPANRVPDTVTDADGRPIDIGSVVRIFKSANASIAEWHVVKIANDNYGPMVFLAAVNDASRQAFARPNACRVVLPMLNDFEPTGSCPECEGSADA